MPNTDYLIKASKEGIQHPLHLMDAKVCKACGGPNYPIATSDEDCDYGELVYESVCVKCKIKPYQYPSPERKKELQQKQQEWDRAWEEHVAKRLCYVCNTNKPFEGARWCADCALDQNKKRLEEEYAQPSKNTEAIETLLKVREYIESKYGAKK